VAKGLFDGQLTNSPRTIGQTISVDAHHTNRLTVLFENEPFIAMGHGTLHFVEQRLREVVSLIDERSL
jgi:hypothetical protein